jgi:transposase-like protein
MNEAAYRKWQRRPLSLVRDLVGAAARYDSYVRVLAVESVRRGATIEDVSKACGVSRQTIYNWQDAFTDSTLQNWLEVAETRVKARHGDERDAKLLELVHEPEPPDEPYDPLLDADAEKVTGGLVDTDTLNAMMRARHEWK